MSGRAHRIAIVGIDGAGKSTLVRSAAEGGDGDIRVVHCPNFHESSEAPLRGLSLALAELSTAADELGSFELKGVAMYLQMTLFGPIARFFEETFSPEACFFERHPIVDALAYAPIYRRRIARDLAREALEPAIEARLATATPGGFTSILAWHASEQRRLGLSGSFWDLPLALREVFALPTESLVAELERRFRTTLPDAIVFVDVPPGEAVARLGGRQGVPRELHEAAPYLTALRDSYLVTIRALGDAHPEVTLRTLALGGKDDAIATAVDTLRGLAHGSLGQVTR